MDLSKMLALSPADMRERIIFVKDLIEHDSRRSEDDERVAALEALRISFHRWQHKEGRHWASP